MNHYTAPVQQTKSALPWIIAVGAVTFAVGVTGALGFAQWQQSQQSDALAALTLQMAQIQNTVTRAATPDLLAIPQVAPTPVVASAPAPAVTNTIPSATAALAATTAPAMTPEARSQEEKIAEAIAIVNRNKMRMLTEGVVAGLYSVTAESSEGQGQRIALNSRNAPSTAAALEQLLATAAANGEIQVPDSIATSDGQVDSQTLLFDLVQRSLEAGSQEEIEAAEEMRRRAFAASAARTDVVEGQRFYTVEGGDSLAYIALQFYGSTNAYEQIFQANRALLSSPDRIQIGQRLLIPNV